MARDTGFNIKAFMKADVVWSPTWISNGHFAVRKELVRLGTHMTSTDAVTCAFPKAAVIHPWEDAQFIELLDRPGRRVEFVRSAWSHGNASLFLDGQGNAAWFAGDYCDSLDLSVLYGPADAPVENGQVSFLDRESFEEATVAIMPMKVSVVWNQMARAVAASVTLEGGPEAAPMMDLQPAQEAETEGKAESVLSGVLDAVMEELKDPNSKAAKAIRPKKGSGTKVTISSPGRRAVTLPSDP